MDIPQIISVDDHVLEPADVWQRYLPTALRERGPRMERVKGFVQREPKRIVLRPDDDGQPVDCWVYDGNLLPIMAGFVAVSFERDSMPEGGGVITDQILPGCSDRTARLRDMDRNHMEASLCFPSFPRFCGQTFLEGSDLELGLACVRAYNDWMIEEWCGDEAAGRLIPLTLVPLWDAALAAAEVRRCAGKGSHAICFSENPSSLGLPSMHSGYWDLLWDACQETDTVVNMHIGSSSTFPTTSPDAPRIVSMGLTFEGASRALVDWLTSGVLPRFPRMRIALSEGQVGWMPFVLERLDNAWAEHSSEYTGLGDRIPQPPSSYVPGRVYGCIFDDLSGLSQRAAVGMDQIMFETDYPHGDSTWPRSLEVLQRLVADAGLDTGETYKLVRGNAIDCYGLERYGIRA